MMTCRNKSLALAGLLVVALLAGCKKEQKVATADELIIPMQPGVIFMGAQMEGNTLWINSYDPKTKACLLRHYNLHGELIIDSPKIRLRGCRIEPALVDASQEQAAPSKPATKAK